MTSKPAANVDELRKIFSGRIYTRDDPDFDLYLDEIQRYRREVDERECSGSSSTPTT